MTQASSGILAHQGNVLSEWIDINGHMNVAYYVLAFDYGVDAIWARAGLTDEFVRTRKMSTFAVESRVAYKAELKEGEPYIVTTWILAVDEKRVHQYQVMRHAEKGFVAATSEWLNLSVDLSTRRVSPFPEHVREGFVSLAREQGSFEIPEDAGRKMKVANPLYAAAGYAERFLTENS